MTERYEFEVLFRGTGEFFASGQAPSLEEARSLAREYTFGDFGTYITVICRVTEIESDA